MKLRLGTRASALATWQADWVARRLTNEGVRIELVAISTAGDQQQQGPIDTIGTQGVFTKEIQKALLDERIDLAVHSLKDLSTEPVPGLALAAVPERGPIGDVLVFADAAAQTLDDLAPGAMVGTGSLRRKTQLLHARADLTIENIRGNVETRLAKLDAGQYDAVVLAEAGLRRLGLGARIGQILPASIMLPAVGQGALGIETRYADAITRKVVLAIDHPPTHAAVLAERALLAALEGGCSAPIAAWGHVEDQTLRLAGRVLRFDGTQKVDATREGKIDQPRQLGQLVAEQLNAQGAAELIQEARRR